MPRCATARASCSRPGKHVGRGARRVWTGGQAGGGCRLRVDIGVAGLGEGWWGGSRQSEAATLCTRGCPTCHLEALVLEVFASTAPAVAAVALAPLHRHRGREQQQRAHEARRRRPHPLRPAGAPRHQRVPRRAHELEDAHCRRRGHEQQQSARPFPLRGGTEGAEGAEGAERARRVQRVQRVQRVNTCERHAAT